MAPNGPYLEEQRYISTPSQLSKNLITNASFRAKKLECDIPRVETSEVRYTWFYQPYKEKNEIILTKLELHYSISNLSIYIYLFVYFTIDLFIRRLITNQFGFKNQDVFILYPAISMNLTVYLPI